jgi:para-aminobenzoate synthetase/4-amino-4-deoxychorismate lyase
VFDVRCSHRSQNAASLAWTPSISRDDYADRIRAIRDYLRRGDTYQVNFTMRLRSGFCGDPFELFLRMQRAQRADYAVYIETEDFAVCCASPELFFRLDGERFVSRPMKGTARRGKTTAEDRALAAALAGSEKERAENVMIVDMVRNDMGRVAVPGSVEVERLFEVERYPTVFQLTSTVAARTSASVSGILHGLFPCASITGAPKVRTMEIIRELEGAPRGIYTGSIGVMAPGRKAWFNVAIRTVMVDKRAGCAEYGVGGGIVWDSAAGDEYQECMNKARVLTADYPAFELIETLLWEGETGYFLFDRHLERLADSAAYFDFRMDREAVRGHLLETGRRWGERTGKVRLLLSRDGRVRAEASDLPAVDPARPRRLAFAAEPVDSGDVFLYHKTTHHPARGRSAEALGAAQGADDVLLWNERGEVTESTIANVVVERGGRKLTPPVASGLLAGVFRGWLLDQGEIEEGVLTIDDVRRAERVFLINSVRKWMVGRVTTD